MTQHPFQHALTLLEFTHSKPQRDPSPATVQRPLAPLVRLLRKENPLAVVDCNGTAKSDLGSSMSQVAVNLNVGADLESDSEGSRSWTLHVYSDTLKIPTYFYEVEQHMNQPPQPHALSGHQNEQKQSVLGKPPNVGANNNASTEFNTANANANSYFGPGVKPMHPTTQHPLPPKDHQKPPQAQPPQQFVSAHALMGGVTRPNKKSESYGAPDSKGGRSNKDASGDRPRDSGVSEDVISIMDQLAEEGGGGEIREDILSVVLSMRTAPGEVIRAEDVVGLPVIKKLLRDKIINPIRRPDLHVGLHKAPRGILLFGPPGTGKTTLAKWIAAESGAQFFEVTASALISKFHGETETLIKALFKVAEIQSPALLFFDEIDSLLSKRRDKEEDATIRMKNQLLQVMDGVASKADKTLVVVGATNRPDMLDDAALRRLTKRVLVPLPDLESRASQISNLLKKHCSGNEQPISDEDCTKIAEMLDGWNGSDVKALCAKAADFSYDDTLAKYGGIENIPSSTAFRPISVDDFLQAAKVVRPTSNTTVSTDGKEPPIDYAWWSETFGCL